LIECHSNEFEFVIPKFQGLGYKDLEFEGLRPRGLNCIGLEFESKVSDPQMEVVEEQWERWS
jgi:hypothetical protein